MPFYRSERIRVVQRDREAFRHIQHRHAQIKLCQIHRLWEIYDSSHSWLGDATVEKKNLRGKMFTFKQGKSQNDLKKADIQETIKAS